METEEFFNKNGFAVIKNLISKEFVDAVTSYSLLKEAYSFKSDEKQVVGAHIGYSDFLMESLLLQYKPMVEWATGLSLIPTYSFYRVYRRGQELVPHIDRESCEISMSVCYGFDYKGKDYDWYLYMDGTPLLLHPGDSAVYKGTEVEHWREVFDVPQDSYHVQCFYHYVNANGPYADFAYDKKTPSHLQYLEGLK